MSVLKIITVESKMNPTGIRVKPDADGYYDVNLGAFNSSNTSGEFYKFTDRTKACFESPKSFLVKKIAAKALYGEVEHPIMSPEISRIIHTPEGKAKWMARQLIFRGKNISHHIKSVRLIPTKIIDPITGVSKIMVKGKIKPYGDYAHYVRDALETGSISAAFSVRTAAIETFENGRVTKEVIAVFTWDAVRSPGITGSTDQGTLGFECDKSALVEFSRLTNEVEGFSCEDERLDACAVSFELSKETIVHKDTMFENW